MVTSNTDVHPTLADLAAALKGHDVYAETDVMEFDVGDLFVLANLDQGKSRLRVRVYLPTDDEQLVTDWVYRQPAPSSGIIQAGYLEDEKWRPRLVFERPAVARDWSTDPIHDDIERFATAWLNDADVDYGSDSRSTYAIADDPRDIAPANAWLLKGTEASYPSLDELRGDREAADVGIFTWEWTTAAQTQVGDLALFYFLSPRKAVHFVARAASDAFFSRDIPVNADQPVADTQWWAHFTTPIEIEPVPVDALRTAAGGHLPLRGRSGLYLRPDTVETLSIRAKYPADQAALDRVLAVPVGLADLPHPDETTFETWRDLAAGALPLEAHVCSHLVEPLLRDVLADTGLTWKREFPVKRRWADYVILDGNTPVHVIEVKKVIAHPRGRDWSESAELAQLRWYADQLGTGGTLIDSHRLLMLERDGTVPFREVLRRGASEADRAAVRTHLLAQ
jgi:hypothetical protein